MGNDRNDAAADVMREAAQMPLLPDPLHSVVPGASFQEQVLDQLSEVGVRTAHIESCVEALVHNLQGPLQELIERTVCLCVEREIAKLGRATAATLVGIENRLAEIERVVKGDPT